MDFEDARARAEVATPEEKLVFMPFGGTYRGKDALLEPS
jgi:hypothetical protein